jgi:hypothetical protein
MKLVTITKPYLYQGSSLVVGTIQPLPDEVALDAINRAFATAYVPTAPNSSATGMSLGSPIGGSPLSGSILYANSSGQLAQDNAGCFIDPVNNQLGVGANTFLATGNVINAVATNVASSQINAQNKSAGNSASTDVVATADTGDNATNYMVHGINSSTYNDAAYTIGGALAGYVQAQGGDMTIGTGTAAKVIKFHTGGTLLANLRATISDTGIVSNFNNFAGTASGRIGYATGTAAGGTVAQGTSRTTGVTLSTPTGAITLFSAAGSATWQSFIVTNSSVAATDVVIVSQRTGTDLYILSVTNVAAGSFRISFATTGGTTTETPVLNYTVIKGSET